MRMKWLKPILYGFGLAVLLSSTANAQAAQVLLNWQDNANNETGQKVQRKLFSEADTAYKEIGSLGANVTTFTDSTVVAGQIYCYRINAFNATGTSPWSAPACMLATPTGVVITYTP